MKTIIKTMMTLQLIAIVTSEVEAKQYENKSSMRNYSYDTLSADIKGTSAAAYSPELRLAQKINDAEATKAIEQFMLTLGLLARYVNTHFKAIEPHYSKLFHIIGNFNVAVNRAQSIVSQGDQDATAKKEALVKEIKKLDEVIVNLATTRDALTTQCQAKSIKASVHALLFSPKLACQLLTELSNELIRAATVLRAVIDTNAYKRADFSKDLNRQLMHS